MIFLQDLDDEIFIWRLKVEVQTSIYGKFIENE